MSSMHLSERQIQLLLEIHKRGGRIEPGKRDFSERNVFEALADQIGLPEAERREKYFNTRHRKYQNAWETKIRADAAILKKKENGYLEPTKIAGRRNWIITEKGRALISELLGIQDVYSTDLTEPPERVKTTVNRIIRDTAKAKELKRKYNYLCQVRETRIEISEGHFYAEVHHIRPLGGEHEGLDEEENMIVLCPNHHAMFDLGIPYFLSINQIRIGSELYVLLDNHRISEDNINYHNARLSRVADKRFTNTP